MSVKVIDIMMIHVMETAPKKDSQRDRKKREGMGQQIPQVIHFCVEDIETQEAQYQHSRDNIPNCSAASHTEMTDH